MFVSSRWLKARSNFTQQGISDIFQKQVLGKWTYSSCCQTMPKINERAVSLNVLQYCFGGLSVDDGVGE